MQRTPGHSDTDPSSPALISWNITLRCPLKCAHCYADAGEDEAEGALTTEEAFRVLDQIAAAGRPVVILSGGEPLMREDIFDIARHGTDRGLIMAMGTSGYLLDRATAHRLAGAGSCSSSARRWTPTSGATSQRHTIPSVTVLQMEVPLLRRGAPCRGPGPAALGESGPGRGPDGPDRRVG